MNQPQDISTMTVEQLKALAYDEISRLEVCKNNLQILNAELQKRANQPEPKVEE
jgi:hypothetical protein